MSRKRLLLIGGVVGLAVILLALSLAVPAFAGKPKADPKPPVPAKQALDDMHEACMSGDYDAMNEAMNAVHVEDMEEHMQGLDGDYHKDMHPDGGMMGGRL